MEALILGAQEIEQKIIRIAHQILEDNYDESKIVFGGVTGMGFKVAILVKEKFEAISNQKIDLVEIVINKRDPLMQPVLIKGPSENLNGGTLILIDDVLNSGATLLHVMKPFIDIRLKKISTVVLVDRSHKKFPVHIDYVGLQLATTLAEHIEVRSEKEGLAAYLS